MIKISKRTFMNNRIVIIINFHLFSALVSIVRRKYIYYIYSLVMTSYCQGEEKKRELMYHIKSHSFGVHFLNNKSGAVGKR